MAKVERKRTFLFVDVPAEKAVKVFPAGSNPDKDEPLAVWSLSSLPQEIRDRLALAGLRTVPQQRASDSDAGPDKLAEMNAVIDYWRETGKYTKDKTGNLTARIPAWLPAAVKKAAPQLSEAVIMKSLEVAAAGNREEWDRLIKKYSPYRETAPAEAVDLASL